MPATLYHLECPEQCELRAGTRFSAQVTEAILAGKPYRAIVMDVVKEGGTASIGQFTRHKKHIVVPEKQKDAGMDVHTNYRASNIEILEDIIQSGFQNRKNWKPTISDTMKAMDMWFRLTQGNPFDELLNTLAAAAVGEETEEETNPAAVRAVGERTDAFEEEELLELTG